MELISFDDLVQAGRFEDLPGRVGRLFFPAGAMIEPTSHAEDEVTFMHSGLVHIRSGGRDFTMRGGNVCFIPAGEMHQAHILEDTSISYVLIERELKPTISKINIQSVNH